MLYCRMAVKYPINHIFLTYSYEEPLIVNIGYLFRVPLGYRKSFGCVIEYGLTFQDLTDKEKSFEIKNLGDLYDKELFLNQNELKLFKWMNKYYHYALGQLIFDTLPMRKFKKERKAKYLQGLDKKIEYNLTKDQKHVVTSILKQMNKPSNLNLDGNSCPTVSFSPFYIHGVTGSGKTLCYLSFIRETLKKHKNVLFLLPEINLTPQFTEIVKNSFSCKIFTFNSSMSEAERYVLWLEVKNIKERCIVIGVRSSLFLPISNLGLIIVDEAHDNSFKQQDRCPYNARDTAVQKAMIENCPIVLCSATPMLEQYYGYTRHKKDNYFKLPNRAIGSFPTIELIDDSKEFVKTNWPLADTSLELIKDALARKEQVLVFINRLGFSQFLQCSNCGYQFTDPETGVNLRYFKKRNTLESNYSSYKMQVPDACPECQNMNLRPRGYGTEKIQSLLESIFPDKVIGRFDRDEITNFKILNSILDDFAQEKIDVLVGTQMLSKGHNFKKVNTILILGIDGMLNFPDFRAAEKVYQTIVQVSGRAGRFSKKSMVYIQTKMLNHPLFNIIQENSLLKFYENYELQARKRAELPPYFKLIAIYFSMKKQSQLIDYIERVYNDFDKYIEAKKLNIDLLGPTPLMVERRAGQYTWVIILRSCDISSLHNLVSMFEQTRKVISGISIKIDVDPYTTL